MAIGVVPAVAIASGHSRHGRTAKRLYIDCGRHRNGDGTRQRPWNELASASRARLRPGTSVLLRRGSVCHGFLATRGSGTVSRPILIGAYGRGALPRIETNGLSADAVRLADESHVVVRDLEITNRGNDSSVRRGIHVIADRPGAVRDIVLEQLRVHDVDGTDQKDLGGSGGIQVDAPTADVVIEDNVVTDVNRSGIWVAGTGRDPRPPAGTAWPSATTGVVIRGNTVMRAGGDGIVPTGTVGAVVADNVVCCSNLRGKFPDQFDAGIWTFNSDGTVIERNEVYDMRNGTADGTGYDIDYNQDGTIVQDNYGHNNAGGFILLCTDDESHRLAEVRFNLSVDEYVFNQSPCEVESGKIGTLDGLRVYNNTFLTASSLIWNDTGVPLPTLPQTGSFMFANNILYATQQQSSPFPCGSHCSHNLFFGLPSSGSDAVIGDPRFVDGTRRGTGRLAVAEAFKLRAGSPAIGAGTVIANGAAADFFGDPVPSPPSIGFYQPG
jgi:Right handed beta helix region